MKINPIIYLLCFVLVLNGCKTLNKDECKTGDWETIGYEDGLRGELRSRVGQHREACAKHGVKIDLQSYNAGYDSGLTLYCQASNGYKMGLSGRVYNSVCPVELEADFLLGYHEGRDIYDLKRQLTQIEQTLINNTKSIETADTQIKLYKNEMLLDSTTAERRLQLWELIETENIKIDELEQNRTELEDELDVIKQEIDTNVSSTSF
ncbi:DUF2799 domain-containing protein [Marinicellulosiphila megalodicopiae]|uniref:DUF2799 domain-containing protein n=1 Tax=Marinicellulosiphila megalodicopiae TaxID=2724896 RepID=UPI003BB10624